jgi:hypothetical protein
VYVAPPPPPLASPPEIVVTPEEPPVVVINVESDFYEPLRPHGEWVVIGSYGRCWRPARVDASWRPYCDGHWERTDSGWYWASNEPWGWATYHYGRWDWSVEFGWFWVPHTQWAPAWVWWRQGGGYVGWAPLPPSARIGARGIVEVQQTAFAPHAFVFVSEPRLLEPVRPATVIVNNTTVINQTVNITSVQVVNKTVINDGPRPDLIERRSGRKIETVAVRELRRKEETDARMRHIPSSHAQEVQPPARTGSAPTGTIPARERPPAGNATDARREPQPAAPRNELRKPQVPAEQSARPGAGRGPGNGPAREVVNENPSHGAGPAATRESTNPARESRQAEQPPGTTRPSSPAARRNDLRPAHEPNSQARPTQPQVERPVGNARQRELDRAKPRPETEQPASPSKSPQQPVGQPADKRTGPGRDKPVPTKRGIANKKTDDKKKGEAQQTPRPVAPPQSPP